MGQPSKPLSESQEQFVARLMGTLQFWQCSAKQVLYHDSRKLNAAAWEGKDIRLWVVVCLLASLGEERGRRDGVRVRNRASRFGNLPGSRICPDQSRLPIGR